VRGIACTSITPEVVVKYVSAFAHLQKTRHGASISKESLPEIILLRDSRISGDWLERIAAGVLVCCGIEVIQCGIQPTPTAQLLAQNRSQAIGAVVITSSHNLEQWNGLKFIDSDGLFLGPDECDQLFTLADQPPKYPSYKDYGKVTELHDAAQQHIQACVSLPEIDLAKTRERNFRVVLDSVNGAGGPIMQELLKTLGCEVIPMNIEPTGVFAHTPEPVPENLGDLCEKVKEYKADLGIAVDPDVDRCVLIDENGKPLGEEYTLALAVEFWLGHCNKRGAVVSNLSSSRASDDIAKKYGCPSYKTPVGEIHVAKKMVEVKSAIGGEGNGGIMLPDIHIGRDALVAATLTIQHLALFPGTISELKATLPQYEIVKLKAPVEGLDPDSILADFEAQWKNKEGVVLTGGDGLRIDTPEYWVHMRKSNTEPIVRVIGEHTDAAQAQTICERFMNDIKSWKPS